MGLMWIMLERGGKIKNRNKNSCLEIVLKLYVKSAVPIDKR